MPGRKRLLASTIGLVALIGPFVANAAAYSVATSGSGPIVVSTSNETFKLEANTTTTNLGRFFLQAETFTDAARGVMGIYPFSLNEAISINDDVQTVSFLGQAFIGNPFTEAPDTVLLQSSSVVFPSAGVALRTFPSPSPATFPDPSSSVSYLLEAELLAAPLKPNQKEVATAAITVAAAGLAFAGCLFFPGCVAALAEIGITPAGATLIQAVGTGLSAGLQVLAADPIDYDYKTVSPPTYLGPPELATAIASANDLLAAETRATALTAAMVTAFNRAEGAYFSFDSYYEQLQLEAYNDFQAQLAGDLRQVGIDYNEIAGFTPSYQSVFSTYGDQLIAEAGQFSVSVPEPRSIYLMTIELVTFFFTCNLFMIRKYISA